MVLRDSEMDFINISCWGSKEYIDRLSSYVDIFSIGKNNQELKII